MYVQRQVCTAESKYSQYSGDLPYSLGYGQCSQLALAESCVAERFSQCDRICSQFAV